MTVLKRWTYLSFAVLTQARGHPNGKKLGLETKGFSEGHWPSLSEQQVHAHNSKNPEVSENSKFETNF